MWGVYSRIKPNGFYSLDAFVGGLLQKFAAFSGDLCVANEEKIRGQRLQWRHPRVARSRVKPYLMLE
jgi:hypothetical protein